MKLNALKFALLICLIPLLSIGQDSTSVYKEKIPTYRPPFLSLRNAKISIGGGFEGALPKMMSSTVNPSGLDIDYKHNRTGGSGYPYISGGISIDIYSENSITGLFGGINYSASTTKYSKENVASDYFSINRLEIPVYLKLRPGAIASTSHLWLLFGGIFSAPVKINRQYSVYNGTTMDSLAYTDTNVSQVNKLFLVSTSVGYEGYIGKTVRGVVFASASYSLNTQFNKNYVEFQSNPDLNPNLPAGGGQSVFASYPNYNSHEIRLTIGVKMLFKLTR